MKIRFSTYKSPTNEIINFESYSTLINTEPVIDRSPFVNAEFIAYNSTIEDQSSEYNAASFLRGSQFADFVRFEIVSVKSWNSRNFLTFIPNKDFVYENSQKTRLILSNVWLSDVKINGKLFTFEQIKGIIIFENIEFRRISSNTCLSISNSSQLIVYIKNMRVDTGTLDQFMFFSQAEVYINGLFLNNISFSDVPLIEFTYCPIADPNGLEITSSVQNGFGPSSPVIYVLNCSEFRLASSFLSDIHGFNMQIFHSSAIVEKTSFLKISFLDFVIKADHSNITFNYCLFSELEGKGFLFKQVKENLLIINSRISNFKGMQVMTFDELKNNILANCEILLINYPNFFWARNLQVEKQLIINTTFSDSRFLRLQSFYGTFSFFPLIVYKNCHFSNMSFDTYFSDYCCLDLFIYNVTYQNIEMTRSSRHFHIG